MAYVLLQHPDQAKGQRVRVLDVLNWMAKESLVSPGHTDDFVIPRNWRDLPGVFYVFLGDLKHLPYETDLILEENWSFKFGFFSDKTGEFVVLLDSVQETLGPDDFIVTIKE